MASRRGSAHQKKQAFRESLMAYMQDKAVDPHYYMVDLIADDSMKEVVIGDGSVVTMPAVSRELKFQAAKELAQYLQPKLRAVELSTEDGAPLFEVVVQWESLPHQNGG